MFVKKDGAAGAAGAAGAIKWARPNGAGTPFLMLRLIKEV
jgi:hypothetical protein